MTPKLNLCVSRWILATGLAIGAAAAQAASGYAISQTQEKDVAVGMSATEVRQTLGPPSSIARYRNEPGPTWIYQVVAAPFGTTEFDVTFGPDGKVASVSEVVLGDN